MYLHKVSTMLLLTIYPLWADMGDKDKLRALNVLLSPEYLALGSGFASTARDCPAFSSGGGWRGQFIKGRRGCMWNGSSWPYTTGIALDALGRQSQNNGHAYDDDWARLMSEYAKQHFPLGDDTPYLTEFYDSVTGEAISDELDYNHSYFIDLVIRYIAGIEPREEGIVFNPLKTGLKRFELRDVWIRGHVLDVIFEAERYTLYTDGRLRLSVMPGEAPPIHISYADL